MGHQRAGHRRTGRACEAVPLTVALLLLASLWCAAARTAPIEAYAAGDIADCQKLTADESTAAATARLVPRGALVLVPGDAIYGTPTLANYRSCYQPTWGVHLPNTLIVPGNHDYLSGDPAPFREYFGAAAGFRGHFAKRIGSWQVIGLDSELKDGDLDRELEWLRSTLAAARDARCTLAFWHRPLFSSGPHRGSGDFMRPFWQVLDEFQADVVINGHEHFYEAFDPQDADGKRVDSGIREFVAGTGGAKLYSFWKPPYSSRARIERHGVLHLKLDDGSYAWEFVDVNGEVLDPGSATCRRAPATP